MLNRNLVSNIFNDLKIELSKLENKYNIKLDLGTCRFDDLKLSLKINGYDKANLTTGHNIECLEYLKHCERFGLKKRWLNEQFSFHGRRYKIIGMKPRNHKYPFICLNLLDGKRYKLNSKNILDNLKEDNFTAAIKDISYQEKDIDK